jgi:hypothetical protein
MVEFPCDSSAVILRLLLVVALQSYAAQARYL